MPELANHNHTQAKQTTHHKTGRQASPPINLKYVQTLTDCTGMMQHGIGGVPDPQTGYTTDDNCRALLAMVRLWRGNPKLRGEVEPLLRTFTQFMLFAQIREGSDAGWFINFFSYDRKPLEKRGTEDCLGRCIWALAESASGDLPTGVSQAIWGMLHLSRQAMLKIRSPHAAAYILCGLCRLPNASNDPHIKHFADFLTDLWHTYKKPGWNWFEPQMTYDNARCVEAVLRVGLVTGDKDAMAIGIDALEFLTTHSFGPTDGFLSPVGNRGWFVQGKDKAAFDQQTIEAGAYAELYAFAAKDLGRTEYLKLADRSRDWFLGDNIHKLSLYDYETGGCCDAITKDGVNCNQGAESTLSYLLAESALLQAEAAVAHR
jgi:hypothetical protein